jgi:hypothetical protein
VHTARYNVAKNNKYTSSLFFIGSLVGQALEGRMEETTEAREKLTKYCRIHTFLFRSYRRTRDTLYRLTAILPYFAAPASFSRRHRNYFSDIRTRTIYLKGRCHDIFAHTFFMNLVSFSLWLRCLSTLIFFFSKIR